MGPINSLSDMTTAVRGRTDEIANTTERLRAANRRLTGSTGQAPVPLTPGGGSADNASVKGEPPLMLALTVALANLEGAMSEMRAELDYLEQFSETGQSDVVKQAHAYGAGRG